MGAPLQLNAMARMWRLGVGDHPRVLPFFHTIMWYLRKVSYVFRLFYFHGEWFLDSPRLRDVESLGDAQRS